MYQDSPILADLSPVQGRRVQAAFDGGMISSNGGLLLLREVERGMGIAHRLAACIADRRQASKVSHRYDDMIRFRSLLIAAGYDDADDCDHLRHDPVLKMAADRLPGTGEALCSQPTMSRLENTPSRMTLCRMMAAMVEVFCDSWRHVPARIVLDFDDTEDRVHGNQQLALFNAHYDSYCFLPMHIFEAASGKPVASILRPGKTPSGKEVATIVKHVVGRIRRHWPRVKILIRGDGHYAGPEVMDWCESNDVSYIFGLTGNAVLHEAVAAMTDDVAVRRAGKDGTVKVRRHAAFAYAAKTWSRQRTVIGRIEASAMGTDRRYVVTNLIGRPKHLYEKVYCARGQAENLIKAHKLHLASDRTSCHSATANQFRLILHSAAYWLMHGLRQRAPRKSFWRTAQFDTIRSRLIKLAARVTEMNTRIKVSLPTACPERAIITFLAARIGAQGP